MEDYVRAFLVLILFLTACRTPPLWPESMDSGRTAPDLASPSSDCVPRGGPGINNRGPCGCPGMQCCKFSDVPLGCLAPGDGGNAVITTCIVLPGPNELSCQPCGAHGDPCCAIDGQPPDRGRCNDNLECTTGVYGTTCTDG